MMAAGKPTDDTIALTAFLLGATEWRYADEIRHAIKGLGFEMPSSQWVVGRLTSMTNEDCARFESKVAYSEVTIYRLTHFAETGLKNRWKGFADRRRPWPVMR